MRHHNVNNDGGFPACAPSAWPNAHVSELYVMTNLLQGRAAFLAIDIEALYEPSVEGKKVNCM